MKITKITKQASNTHNPTHRSPAWYQLRSRWMVVSALAILIAVGLQACSLPGENNGGGTATNTAPSGTPVPNPPYHRFATVQYCIDSTGSYPNQYFQAANNYVANSINGGIQANEAGFNVYVTYINADPTDPASTPLTFQVPAIPAYPTHPPTPTPIPTSNNGFSNGSAKATAATQATQAAWNQQYPADDATVTAQVTSAQKNVAPELTSLRNLPKNYSPDTSVWGCLYEASERFSNAQPGDKWLVIASDMQNNTSIDITKVNFQGVKVRVIDFYCGGSSGDCQTTQNQWTSNFEQAGAASSDVKFFQPAETRTHPLLFSGGA